MSAAAVATSAAFAVSGLEAGAVSAAGSDTGVVAAAVPDAGGPAATQVASVATVPGASPTISTPLAQRGRLFYGTAAAGGGKLWEAEGTHATLIKQIPGHHDGAPTELTAVGDDLYFEADGELWKSNGTAKGTVDVDPHVDPIAIADADGTVFVETAKGLWKSRGTERETTELKPLALHTTTDLVAVNGRVYFTAPGPATFQYPRYPGLWTSNGTAAGTEPVLEAMPYGDYPRLYQPSGLTNVGGQLFFSAKTDPFGNDYSELWKLKGGKGEAIEPYGSDLTNVAGSLYFFDFATPHNCSAQTEAESGDCAASTGYALWENTTPLADFAPSVKVVGAPTAAPYAGELTPVGATLFFAANDGSGATQLWMSNGTQAGTTTVDAVDPTQLTNVNGTLCFSAEDGSTGPQVWESDGTATGTTPVTDFADAGTGTTPGDLTNLDGTLYFTANDGSAGGYGLWELTP